MSTTGWTSFDVAERYGWGPQYARTRLRRWLDAGLVSVVGRERLTGARMYDRAEVERAHGEPGPPAVPSSWA